VVTIETRCALCGGGSRAGDTPQHCDPECRGDKQTWSRPSRHRNVVPLPDVPPQVSSAGRPAPSATIDLSAIRLIFNRHAEFEYRAASKSRHRSGCLFTTINGLLLT